MTIRGLRTTAGAEATQTGVVVGRLSTGAGELEEVTIPLSGLHRAPVTLTGDYSDGTVLANLVAALVTLGLITDSTTP
jgi:hypothetical protein